MQESISQLNRNTSLKNGGLQPESEAMNHFFELILTHLNDKDVNNRSYRSEDSKYNILSNMLCFDDISDNLRQTVEGKMQEIDRQKSIENLMKRQESFGKTNETGAIKR